MKKILLLTLCTILFLQYSQGQNTQIPDGVIYHKTSDKVNKEVEKLIKEAIIKNKLLPVNKTFICGPNLWGNLVKKCIDKQVTGINVNFHIPSKNRTTTVHGRAIQDEKEYQIIWDNLFSNINDLKIRKPNAEELSQYWAIISYEIEEPIFVVEIKGIKFILDLDNRNNLLFIEKV